MFQLSVVESHAAYGCLDYSDKPAFTNGFVVYFLRFLCSDRTLSEVLPVLLGIAGASS